jgi:NitT/TauT family transport system substrate-binding protein
LAVTRFRNGSEVAQLIDRGELDSGLGGHLQTLAVALSGSEQSFFAAVGFEEAPDHLPVAMVVGNELSETGLADGAAIAMSARAAISDLQLRIFSAAQGIEYSSLKIVAMPFVEMHTALANREVDAASVPDPFATQIELSGAGTIVDRGTLGTKMPAHGRVMITGLVSTKGWIEEHRELAGLIKDVVQQAVNETQPTSEVAERAVLGQEPIFDTQLRRGDLQLAFDLAADFGVVPERLPAESVIAIL